MVICIPKRIQTRWAKHHNLSRKNRYTYDLTGLVKKANISVDDFKNRWSYVRPRLSNDELFSLCKDFGFAFVNNVVQLSNDAKVFFGLSLSVCIFVCVCAYLFVCA